MALDDIAPVSPPAAEFARRKAVAAALRDVDAGEDPNAAASALGVDRTTFDGLAAQAAEARRARLSATLPLRFHDAPEDAEKEIHQDLSALVSTGDGEGLWVGADEGAALERLIAERGVDGRILGYGGHKRFQLKDFFDFPNGTDEEADVEGLAISDGYLWVVGSHSLKRRKPKRGQTAEEALERLTQVVREGNRFLLGRIPLAAGDRPGVLEPVRKAPAIDSASPKRKAGCVAMGRKHSALSRLLARDVHLGPFMRTPSKDNGLDIEGVAVRGDRVFLGLRGPVLRGWAVVVELRVAAKRSGALKLTPVDEDGALYSKHFLDLDGLGVRSLMLEGQDLILLAGPTMDLDGPVRLYRWRGALASQDSSVVPRAQVERVLDMPFGEGVDHAEGATLIALAPGEAPTLVVAYDTPAADRVLLDGDGALADVFELPEHW
ncbi:DUF3616 domain-containing protein [Methylopila musalis]|uniref:DUF3616 domain-containing protein n=1 Tax=Methylopila musalis TaxID=1134781 RepID=A0ABW3ZB89_9HYPH